MNQIDKLLTVADAYCCTTSLSQARVSTLVFNDGKRLKRLASGGDVGTKAHERAMEWFSDNWPNGADWPMGVDRPTCNEQRGAAE